MNFFANAMVLNFTSLTNTFINKFPPNLCIKLRTFATVNIFIYLCISSLVEWILFHVYTTRVFNEWLNRYPCKTHPVESMDRNSSPKYFIGWIFLEALAPIKSDLENNPLKKCSPPWLPFYWGTPIKNLCVFYKIKLNRKASPCKLFTKSLFIIHIAIYI